MRMRFRFSLRAFLISFTLLAVALGAAANFYYEVMQPIWRHEAARARLAELGVYVMQNSASDAHENLSWREPFARKWIDSRAFPVIGSLDVIQDSFSPSCETVLKAAHGLRGVYHLNVKTNELSPQLVNLLLQRDDLISLHLTCNTIAKGAAGRLPELSALRQLIVRQAISKEQFEAIAQAPHLEYLNLNVTALTPSETAPRRRFPALIQATLNGTVEGPEIVRTIADSERVFRLTLSRCKVSSGCLAPLENAKSLRMVHIERGCDAPGGVLAEIAKAPELESLAISRSFSAEALDLSPLVNSKSIQEIELNGIELSAAELQSLLSIPQLQSLSFADMGETEAIPFLVRDAKLRRLSEKDKYPLIFEWNSRQFAFWGRTLHYIPPGTEMGAS